MKQNKLKKFGLWVVATIASISLIVASVNESPSDIIKNENDEDNKNKITITNKEKKSVFSRIADKIPFLLKVFLMFPLWLIGSILLKILEPFKKYFLLALVTFLILSLIVFIVAKLLFPDLKLKEIFNKKTLVILSICSLTIPLINFVLSVKSGDYRKYILLVDFFIGMISLIIILIPLFKLKRKILAIVEPK